MAFDTYMEMDNIGLVWLDGDKVDSDDGQLVLVDTEALNSFGTRVNQTKKMLLSLLELEASKASIGLALPASSLGPLAVVTHLAIDEVVLGRSSIDNLGNLENCK